MSSLIRNSFLNTLQFMRKYGLTLLLVIFAFVVNAVSPSDNGIKFHPILHASLIIEYNNLTIYVDPAGDANSYNGYKSPNIILITHTHGDHFNQKLIDSIKNDQTTIIGSQAAIDILKYGIAMLNGEKTSTQGIGIEAVPMYNTSPERLNYHPKGVGNGYVLTINKQRIYIAGDTEDIPEMRALTNIDHAFVCMNLPFTMTPEQAASAVLSFKPKNVYPYHYSQKGGFSDIEKFKTLVSENKQIKVVFLNWYKPVLD